jgi:hypothetical protein
MSPPSFLSPDTSFINDDYKEGVNMQLAREQTVSALVDESIITETPQIDEDAQVESLLPTETTAPLEPPAEEVMI